MPVNNDKKSERESYAVDIEKLKELAETGDATALYALGTAYLFGWEVEEDIEKGIKMLEEASEDGEINAMTMLVRLFMSQVYHMDPKKAIEYATTASENGNCDAMLFLGTAYMDGFVVEQDYKKAAELFKESAENGNIEAMNSFGYLLQEGLGVDKDPEKAFDHFLSAAENGLINAFYQVGACYEDGTGVKHDLKKAIEWYTKASEQGDTYAMERLGVIYYCGSEDLPQNPELSFKWFLDAALGGMLGAMFYVGVFHIEGFGVEKDREEGIKWLKLAASSGNTEAGELVSVLESEGDPPVL